MPVVAREATCLVEPPSIIARIRAYRVLRHDLERSAMKLLLATVVVAFVVLIMALAVWTIVLLFRRGKS
jgi:hypothetical protein